MLKIKQKETEKLFNARHTHNRFRARLYISITAIPGQALYSNNSRSGPGSTLYISITAVLDHALHLFKYLT